MQPIPFDPASDLPPTPFDDAVCALALELKRSGLPWTPHVGCFVWDPDKMIQPDSPFPNRIYFILSLPRFQNLFGTLTAVQDHLVWLPTWHQACLLCRQYGIDDTEVGQASSPTEALKKVYRLLIDRLSSR